MRLCRGNVNDAYAVLIPFGYPAHLQPVAASHLKNTTGIIAAVTSSPLAPDVVYRPWLFGLALDLLNGVELVRMDFHYAATLSALNIGDMLYFPSGETVSIPSQSATLLTMRLPTFT